MTEDLAVRPTQRPESIFESDLSLHSKLERARTELLDLSARNRLLNIPRSSSSARVVEVVDEVASEVFRLLVTEGKSCTFLPGRSAASGAESEPADAEEVLELAQPEDDGVDARGVSNRHADTRLQTRLTSKGLQKRLLEMFYDARTLEEEQGVNILYLAIGTLRWVDPNNAANRRSAPLILVPVALERGSAGERFKLRWRQEDVASNLSLEAYLDRQHMLRLPTMEAGDQFDPTAYLAAVASAISTKTDWSVEANDIVLGFFSFAKFLMYRDLDPQVWPEGDGLVDRRILRSLLSDGFEHPHNLVGEDADVDAEVAPKELLHIVDSDSSQTMAVHEVRRGRDLVIQGPPGTGKSQTIANVIASAVADGKTVLFVAEKMAALEVVKRRLDAAGVGDMCLELHSSKANKRALLEELKRTWELGAPRASTGSALYERLGDARDHVNAHSARMHREHQPSGVTPYVAMGHLVRLRAAGQAPTSIPLEDAATWTPADLDRRAGVVVELAQRVEDIGVPADHVWRGVGLTAVLATDVERLTARMADLLAELGRRVDARKSLAKELELTPPATLAAFDVVVALAGRLAGAPELAPDALAAAVWDDAVPAIRDLLAAGAARSAIVSRLSAKVSEGALHADLASARDALGPMPPGLGVPELAMIAELARTLPRLMEESARLSRELGVTDSAFTLSEIDRAVEVAEAVAKSPPASSDAFVSAAWERGVDEADGLASAVERLRDVREDISSRVSAAAWTTDVASPRAILAASGSGLFRYFSGEWRRADRLARSILAEPKLPIEELVPLLDRLMEGQAAAAAVTRGDEFGRSAFGADWRQDRSDPAGMRAMIDWMRGLHGLGDQPRLLASRVRDRVIVAERASRARQAADEVRSVLKELWPSIAGWAERLPGGELGAERVDLSAFTSSISVIDEALRTVAGVLADASGTLGERIGVVDAIIEAQRLAEVVESGDATGHKAFGSDWNGLGSDWPRLSGAAGWVAANMDVRGLAARVADRPGLAERAAAETERGAALAIALDSLFSDLDLETGFWNGRSAVAIPLDDVVERLSLWHDADEQLSKWVAWSDRARAGRELGMAALVDALFKGAVTPGSARATFEMAYYEALLAAIRAVDSEIGRFDGELHRRRVAEFATLDQERIAASRLEVVAAHHRRIPQGGGAAGPLGVLRAEIARRRGHMPIRQLMQRAAPAVQAMKPVLMMSPLSVAQFLAPGALDFDLLVMDEASQIQPVDALGAIARCRQVVVVGDERQLPPTRFFAKMTSGDGADDEDDAAQVADIESILGLFTAKGLPQRMLRWHYRSRHQSLIAVSNSQFYENRLFIVPSPYTQEAGMGLQFHHLPDGVFDAGGSGANEVEARVVAAAILRHAAEKPHLSLGVATFSVRQRRAITDELERLRRLNPATEGFFHQHPSEPFFVKNLENVQGDERDVIFISVGYGRNAQGRMMMRFGPLSAEGGERRLNVLISRAKRRCEVFSSITDEDIDTERGKGQGVFAFKLFLHFARTGRLALAEASARGHDSPFEEQVASALRGRGYVVRPQVGIAGFFIDLAIVDAERPGRYVLGIECDGAAYHSARSARDRDRLRQAVLEDHGWTIHRIWSTDWFQRPKEQLERTVAAIEAAKAELAAEPAANASGRAVAVEIVTIERGDTVEVGLDEVQVAPRPDSVYEQARFDVPSASHELHEAPVGVLAGIVTRIVATEGPVHVDEVVARVRTLWGLGRAGGRIQGAVEGAIAFATGRGDVVADGRCLSVPGSGVRVRDRSRASSPSLRRPEMLPPAEIAAAAVDVVRANLGARREEVLLSVSRALGFKATSSQLRGVVMAVVDDLVVKGDLVAQGDVLVLGGSAPA